MQHSTTPARMRDSRLDVLRGVALVMIFINHVPGNVFEHFTSRNFGFSDAAEGFVLMSGIAAGLAYSGGFKKMPFVDAAARMWVRARKLYFVHLLIIALAMLLLYGGWAQYATFDLADRTNFTRLTTEPAAALAGVATLGHQLAYFNILPLYVVLLLAAPAFIAVGRRSMPAMLALSAAIWFLAGLFRINIPNFPGDGGWFFNPFAWQFLFVIGLAGGMSAREGRSLVAYRPMLFHGAVLFLLVSAYWVMTGGGSLPGSSLVPFHVGGFDKSYLPLPRLLHVLALAYVLINLDIVAAAARSRFAAPLDLMGRNGLPVFASGSVIAIALQVYGEIVQTDFLSDALLLGTGILIQYWIAAYASLPSAPAIPVSKPVPVRVRARR